MKVNVVLAALFLGVGLVLVVVGGWFGLMVGVVALLMGLVLVVRGYRLRAAGELSRHWPESRGLLPPDFGGDPDRLCVLELERDLAAGEDAPDSPAEIA